MSIAPRPFTSVPTESSGGRLVTVDGRPLPLLGASLTADAKAGLIRVVLEQTFRNPHDEPLRVRYSLPLPADGAVSGFSFRIGGERVVGQVDTKSKARERFEDAVLEGRTAAILDQERSSLFTQEVGNVPPRTEVVCEVQIDQKLAWLPDGAWEWRFPTVVAPRYMGAPGRVADAAQISVDVADAALPVKLSLALTIRDRLPEGVRPASPSHSLHTVQEKSVHEVTFADDRGASLDRDVVIRFHVGQPTFGIELDVSRAASGLTANRAFGLFTMVPPTTTVRALPRDLIVLLDTSGSMSGAPLEQALRVTAALVDSLTDRDQLELIEFSNSPRRWKHAAVSATSSNRRDAQAWLARLRASGGTEMRQGILEALAPLRLESQRQVVLITDGLIGSEHEVLEAIGRRLPAGSRVHTIGVGSGVNRSMLMPAARAGRGIELNIGLGEDVEPLIARLLARTTSPLVTDVRVSGSALVAAPTRIADLFGGSPAMIPIELNPRGGELRLTGRTAEGEIEEVIQLAPIDAGGSAATRCLFARELVEDLELDSAIDGKQPQRESQIEGLGIAFQISTRLTSWVAVSANVMVDPRAPKRQDVMPHELAYGMSAEGVGLRAPMVAAAAPMGRMRAGAAMPASMVAPAPARKSLRQETTGSYAAVPADEDNEERAPMKEEAQMMRDEAPGYSPPPPPSMPAPAPAAAPARPSLFEKAKKIFGKGSARRQLRGKVRKQGTKWIVEIDVASDLRWSPGARVLLNLLDGKTLSVTVNPQLTTADGTFTPGVIVTLVFEAEAEFASIFVDGGGEPIEIVL